MNKYQAFVQKSGKYWAVEVPEFGCTQARTWSEIESMAVDYVHCYTDIPHEHIEVEIHFKFAPTLDKNISRAVLARTEARRAAELAAQETKAVAVELFNEGCSIREIGQILEVSHQRAHQLVKSA